MSRITILCLLFIMWHITAVAQSLQWAATLEVAKHDAHTEGKKIFVYFSGSDWCKPCIQLRERTINSSSFTKFARNNLVLLQADFPRLRKNRLPNDQVRRNEALAEMYNTEGTFPLVVILNAEGVVLAKVGYHDEQPEEFVHRIAQCIR